MRVVLDARTATDHFPGIGRYVSRLCRALAASPGPEDLWILRDPVRLSPQIALPPVPHVDCAVSPFAVRQQWVVPRALARAGAALYHSPYYLMPYRPGVPTVVTCYDVIPLSVPEGFNRAERLVYRVAHRLAFRAAARIVVPSAATQADLAAYLGVDASRVTVVPLAGDPEGPPPAEDVVRIRAARHLHGPYVLSVGTNKPHKNLARLILAWAEVVKALAPSARMPTLVLAGPWDDRYQEPKALVAALELDRHVRFLGPVSDDELRVLYAGADVLAFPSLAEGFGLPVAEAMSHGVPVACGRLPALIEVVGEGAAWFDPLVPESMADTLIRVLADRDEHDRLAEIGRQRARELSWDRVAAETRQIYRQVLERA